MWNQGKKVRMGYAGYDTGFVVAYALLGLMKKSYALLVPMNQNSFQQNTWQVSVIQVFTSHPVPTKCSNLGELR